MIKDYIEETYKDYVIELNWETYGSQSVKGFWRYLVTKNDNVDNVILDDTVNYQKDWENIDGNKENFDKLLTNIKKYIDKYDK